MTSVTMLLIVFSALAGAPPGRDDPAGKAYVSLAVRLSQDGIPRGGAARAALLVTVKKGWHINAPHPADENLIPTTASFSPPEGVEVRDLRFPPAASKRFRFSDEPLDVYEGTQILKMNIAVAPGVQEGTYEVPVEISYQACSEEVCLPPATARAVIPVRVLPGNVSPRKLNGALFGDAATR